MPSESFLQFHATGEEPLRDDEITILNGVLSLNQTSAGASESRSGVRGRLVGIDTDRPSPVSSNVSVMTPIADVMTLSTDSVLDHVLLDKIL